ncbi:hypothetical protein JCM8547_007736, partial [Rhodosporidiobolus lusitaniae]
TPALEPHPYATVVAADRQEKTLKKVASTMSLQRTRLETPVYKGLPEEVREARLSWYLEELRNEAEEGGEGFEFGWVGEEMREERQNEEEEEEVLVAMEKMLWG